MPTFKLGVIRHQVLEYRYEAEVEAVNIHAAAAILRERAEQDSEAPDYHDVVHDGVRIIAWDGEGIAHDIE
jgi:uncharacterized protein (DUF736 family)